MKKDWLHIKFADAFVLNMGKTPARAEASYWTDGMYPWVSISDLSGDKFITHTKEQISQKAVNETNIHLVPKGTVIMSFKLSIGKTAIAPFDLYTNEAIMAFEPKPEISVVPDFLYYYLQYYKWSGNRAVMGETINKAVISNSYADIPPLSIQRSIVAELDLLHSVISKKKEQLRELDNLAQSLFYQMFGDPITNPMGWEIKKLGECFPYIKNGANIKQDRNAGGIPITRIETLSGGVFNRHKLGYADIFELGKYEHYVLSDGDLLLSHINSKIYIGRTVEYKKYGNEQIIHGMNLLCLKADKEILSSTYFAYFTHCEKFKNDIARIRKDAVNQSSISISDLKNISLPLPPLSLQQSFAAKVSAIEAQKQAITQSIQHTEALLAQRMDNYFGI